MAFTADSDSINHALAAGEHHANTVTVEITPLDNVLQEESPALAKVDVEGYELPVLQGAMQSLERQTLKAVILELNGSGRRYGFDESKVVELMLNYGFKSYSYDPLDRSLAGLKGKNLDSGNTLFIRDESFVEKRVRSAPQLSIHGRRF